MDIKARPRTARRRPRLSTRRSLRIELPARFLPFPLVANSTRIPRVAKPGRVEHSLPRLFANWRARACLAVLFSCVFFSAGETQTVARNAASARQRGRQVERYIVWWVNLIVTFTTICLIGIYLAIYLARGDAKCRRVKMIARLVCDLI